MSEEKIPIHYVCTYDKGLELINQHNQFWVCDCECRIERVGCKRSRIDVCLMFVENYPGIGTGKKAITRVEVDAILKEAKEKHLVTRPFRNEARTAVDGICFCCDCCCGYFQPDSTYVCAKGEFIEQTNMADCTHCGECEAACYFKARKMKDDMLVIERDNCYGCGLCVDNCPVGCIELIKRN